MAERTSMNDKLPPVPDALPAPTTDAHTHALSTAGYSGLESALFFALYGPHCLLQEVVARGVIQGSLERYLGDRNPQAGLLVASAMFGVFHLHVSLTFALATFGVSLVFGILYARRRSLAGPTAAHLMLGLASVAFGLN